MFKKVAMIAALAVSSTPVFADEPAEEKKFSVGIASFATVIRADTGYGTGLMIFQALLCSEQGR